MKKQEGMLGPIDYVAVGFKGNNFDGSILEELSKAVDSGAIRVIDLVFAIKDKNGDIAVAEIEDQHGELKDIAEKSGYTGDMPLLTEDDISKLGKMMDNDTSAGLLVIEQLWAKGLKKALMDHHGELIAEGRIHPENVEAAIQELELAHA
jgi:uncharacterized protein YihD (DUF1040 family)